MNTSQVIPAAFDLAPYDVRSPRYTSYPTALQFRDDFNTANYAAWWPDAATNTSPLSLYVHIPFCRDICYYCACNKIVTRRPEDVQRYLNYLKKEIVLQSAIVGSKRPVMQMHFGGGTPTYLNGAQLTELVHTLANNFNLVNSAEREYSIEIDPRTVDRSALALLKGLNFNRISFGVQDFDARVQQAINRTQPFHMLAELTAAAREFDFSSINFDLIYGLPLQTVPSFTNTLRCAIALRPDRIALYNYAHLPERFSSQRALDRLERLNASVKLTLLELASEMLIDAGYVHIGMDHFVLPDDALALAQLHHTLERNFQGYSTSHSTDLVGLGLSAISSTEDGYAQNAKELDTYYQHLDAQRLPIVKGILMSDDDRVRKFVIMQIICNLSLDFSELRDRFQIEFFDYFSAEQKALKLLQDDGLIEQDLQKLVVTNTGRPLLRNICMVFDHYLQDEKIAQPSRNSQPPMGQHSNAL